MIGKVSIKKILIRIGIGFASLILLLWIALVIITVSFGDKIKSLAIAELNKQLATEIKVNGDIRFSLFSNFPYAAITLNQVVIKETLPEKNDLVNCEKVSLLFNIWKLLHKNYVIEKITAEKGKVAIHLDAQGHSNYNIFRKSDSSSSDFKLQISNAELHDFEVRYFDEKNDQDYSFRTGNATLKGNFSSSKFTLTIDADAFSQFLKINNTDYLPQRDVKFSGKIDCDLSLQEYVFQNSTVLINGNEFQVNGKVTSRDAGNDLQLKISAGQLALDQLLSLLPESYVRELESFSSTGKFSFQCEMNGIKSSTSNPQITAGFQLKNATISHKEVKHVLENLNLEGTYTSGTSQNLISSEISIRKFTASIDDNPLTGSLALRDFMHPVIDVMLDGSIQLAKIYPLIHADDVKSLEGLVNIHECYFRGPVSQLTSPAEIHKLNAGGKFEMNNVKIVTNNATYEKLGGAFEIRNNDIIFSNCAFIAGQSDLKFDGSLTNFFPFVFAWYRGCFSFIY